MDVLFIAAVAELTLLSLLALILKSKYKIFFVIFIGVVTSWYIGILRVEMFNDIATQELEKGLREGYPSNGASSVFSLYLGWVPGLVYSLLVFGISMVLQVFIINRNKNENT